MDTKAERSGDALRPLTALPSRRDVLRGLTASGLGFAVLAHRLQGGDDVWARKRGKKQSKKKHKKPSPQTPVPPPPPFNAYGCLDVGQSCLGDSSLCCSGICDPKSSSCVAHNRDVCFPDTDYCASNAPSFCNGNNPECLCITTTGNAGFCADFGDFSAVGASCRLCSTDTECQAELGPGAACVILAGACSSFCPDTDRTACMRPCV